MFFQTSQSEHVEFVIVCNTNEFMVFECIIPLTQISQNLDEGLFKINIRTEKVLTFGEGNLLPAPGFFHFLLLSLLFQDVSGQVAMTGDAFHLWVVLKLLYQLLVVVCGSFFSGGELLNDEICVNGQN